MSHEQEQRNKKDRALYKSIRSYLDKNPDMTVKRACEEKFNIHWSRYYTVKKKQEAYEAAEKKPKKAKTVAQKKPEPAMDTISHPAEVHDVTPEIVVPFHVSGNENVMVLVTAARNVGFVVEQIIPRL